MTRIILLNNTSYFLILSFFLYILEDEIGHEEFPTHLVCRDDSAYTKNW